MDYLISGLILCVGLVALAYGSWHLGAFGVATGFSRSRWAIVESGNHLHVYMHRTCIIFGW